MGSALGLTMQRWSHVRRANNDEDTRPGCELEWSVGVALCIVAAVPNVLSYTLAPMVVCGTVNCLQLVFVTILASVLLHEPFSGRSALGMLVCCCGAWLCLYFGPSGTGTVRTEEELYTGQVVFYLIGALSVMVALLLFEHGEMFGVEYSRYIKWHRITLPLACSLVYGTEKVFNSGLALQSDHTKMFFDPLFLMSASMTAALGALDFYMNTLAVWRLPIQLFVPMSFGMGTTIQYVQSVGIFEELNGLPWVRWILSILGMLMALCGAIVIQKSASKETSSSLIEA